MSSRVELRLGQGADGRSSKHSSPPDQAQCQDQGKGSETDANRVGWRSSSKKAFLIVNHVGALIIRIGFWGFLIVIIVVYIIYTKPYCRGQRL